MRAATLAPRAVSVAQGSRVRPLGHVGESLGPPAQEQRKDDDPAEPEYAERDVDGRAEALEGLLPVVAEQPEDRRPDDAAGSVPREEAPPLHLADARQECRVRAQDRHEPPEEHDLAAVAVEDVSRDLQVTLLDAQLRAVLQEQPVAALAADRVADVVADHRARERGGDHPLDQEVPGG